MRQIADRRRLLLWPGIAVAAMFVLGWAVGKRSTTVDDWFLRHGQGPIRWLLLFSDPWVLAAVLAMGVAAALYQRRWRLVLAMVASPVIGIALAQMLKPLFMRQKGIGAFAYPSGHITATVVVMGMIVVVAGAAVWVVLGAAAFVALAAVGQAVTYHYFTDTVGAVLLGTAVVCVAALATELDTRQPGCDADHTGR